MAQMQKENSLLKVMDISATSPDQSHYAPATDANGLPLGAQISLITNPLALMHLAKAWRELEQTCHIPPTVFQSYDWVKTWADIHLTAQANEKLFIIVGHLNNRLVYVMPLSLSKRRGLRMLTWLTQPIAQYGDILCDKSIDAAKWTEAAINFIKQQNHVDLIRLRHVRATSNIGAYAAAHLYDAKLHEQAPTMDLTRFATEAAYDARYDGDQRRRRRRIRAKIEKLGVVAYETLGAAEVSSNIDQALEEKRKWLAERGRYNCVFSHSTHAEFLKAMARQQISSIETVTTRLSAGDRPVTWEIGFVYQGTQYQYLTSHMADLTDLSPSRLAFDLSQRQALRNGVKNYDLMVPYDPHKESWATRCEPVNDFYLPLTASGAFYGHVYVGTLRPMLRKAYKALPQSVLRRLQKLLHY
ncbi:MAG TPA: GNAT family N-acetyltransferase [Aestuariivirga sp.]